MDIGEGMCYGECSEVCKPDDLQTRTPGANNTLYVNKKYIKKILLKTVCSLYSIMEVPETDNSFRYNNSRSLIL